MLSKKHNDPFYWKNKLEALECLPGEAALEKNAMWEKLDNRLHKTKPDSKAIWFWIAAGLLPLIIVTCAMLNDTENTPIKQVIQKNKNANTAVLILTPVSKETAIISVSAPIENKQPISSYVAVKEKKILMDTIKANESITAIFPEEPVIEPTTDNTLTTDTAFAIATATAVKKKLPVIHINELEAFPVQFTAPVNYAGSVKLRKSKTNNQNITTNQNRIGFNIKLSSKN
jgi:hypothetical protein